MRPRLLNNCHGRPHSSLFGPSAFFDLECSDPEKGLAPGTECVVAGPAHDSKLAFKWYIFSHEEIMRDPDRKVDVRVFHGTYLNKKDVLSRAEARRAELYSSFFDRNGSFLQQSVVRT